METTKTIGKNERISIPDQYNKTVNSEELEPSKKGFNFYRNNDFFSSMLDLDPGRHRVIENDW